MKNQNNTFEVAYSRRALGYLLCTLLAVQPVMPAFAAGISVANGNTSTEKAANGVPVVNIATPNGAGVSHNQYQNFNVGKEGLILNNATGALNQTQLGGIIQNNPNLKAGQEAKAIINEVVGANRSQLQGYTEVAGKQANVMVANPYGITCDGCGFINTPNVTLTTGKPTFDAQGNLQALEVTQGSVTINGKGLDASQSSSAAIIARATEINAELHAQDLSVIAGSNRVNKDGSVTPIASSSQAPAIAVDTSALGGMYANRIRLVSSDKGVGVNLGNINARQGDIQLDVNGKLTLNNSLAQGKLTAQADELQLSGNHKAGGDIQLNSRSQTNIKQSIVSSGGQVSLNSQGKLTLTDSTLAAGVDAQGKVGSNGSVKLEAQNQQWQNSQISAAQVKVKSTQALQQDANSGVTGLTDINLEAAQLTLDGKVSAGRNVSLAGTRLQTGSQSKVVAQQNLNATFTERVDSLGEISAGGAISLSTGQWLNQGLFAANGNSVIGVASLNNQGNIQALGSQNISAGTLLNSGSMLSGAGTTIAADKITISGKVGSQQALTLTAREWLKVDASGLLLSDGSLSVRADSMDFWGLAKAQQDVQLNVSTLNAQNGSQLLSDSDITIEATNSTLAGLVSANGALSLDSSSLTLLESAQIQAQQNVTLDAAQRAQLQGTLVSGNNLVLNSASTELRGILQAANLLTLSATAINQQGTLQGTTIQIDGQQLTNSGTILALNQLTINSQQTDNQSSGKLFSAGDLTLVSNTLNHSGQILALNDIAIRLQQDFSQTSTIAAGNALSLSTLGAFTQSGTLQGQSVNITSGGVLTNQGNIVSGTGVLSLSGADIVLGDSSHLQSGGDIEITSQRSITHSGFTGAAGDLTLTAANEITNKSLLYAANDMRLFADKISNIKGDILAGNSLWMQRNAQNLANSLVLNSSGTIETINGDISINTAHLLNTRDGLSVTKTDRDLTAEYDWMTGTEVRIPYDQLVWGEFGFYLIAYEVSEGGAENGGSRPVNEFYLTPLPGYEIRDLPVYISTLDVTSNGNAARIASGRDLHINSGLMDNQASNILANKDIFLSGSMLNNESFYHGTETHFQTYQYEQKQHYIYYYGVVDPLYLPLEEDILRDGNNGKYSWYYTSNLRLVDDGLRYIAYKATGDSYYKRSDDSEYYRSTIQAGGSLYAYFDDDISNTATVANAGNISHTIEAPDFNGFGDLSLPDGMNGLFVTSENPDSPYLITTNPKLNGLGGLDNSLFNNLYALLGMQPGAAPRETNSLYTDRDRFLGSAYFLERLNLNPDYDYRFLGDAAFDTRYISDALIKQTGSRYINGIGSDLDQMQYLIDNAADAQAGLNLTFGVSLTPEQVAALDKSIVWWEPVTVNGETVLAPRLYLAKNDITTLDGSVIKGDHVELDGGRVINSNSSIVADNSLFIDSWSTIDNVNAGQIVAGGFLGMTAMDDISNIGSTIKGQMVDIESIDGSIINRTETQQWSLSNNQNFAVSKTEVGDIASIQSQGSLSLTADKNIDLVASEVRADSGALTLSAGQDINIETAQYSESNQKGKNKTEAEGAISSVLESGGSLSMSAGRDINAQAAEIVAEDSVALSAGHDVNLTTAESRVYQETHGKRSQQIDESIRQQGTEIASGGNVQIVAGRDANFQAAEVQAEGNLNVFAGNDINVTSATESDYHFFEETKVKKKTFSKTTTHTIEQDYATYEKGSLLSGDKVTLSAGHDLKVEGSSVVGEGNVVLAAGNNVDIIAATEEQSTYRLKEVKKSGFMSGGSLGFTVGSQSTKSTYDGAEVNQSDARSLVGTSGGNVIISAGNTATISGSDIVAGRAIDDTTRATGHIDITAQDIVIKPGRDVVDEKVTQSSKSSGFGISLSVPLVDSVRNFRDILKSDDGDVKKTKLLIDEAGATGADWSTATQLPISYGRSSSYSETTTHGEYQSGSNLSAAGNIQLNATGNGQRNADGTLKNGDVIISGSKLGAGESIIIDANRDVVIAASTDSQNSTSKSSSSSWNIDGTMPTLGSVGRTVSGGPNHGASVLPFSMDKSQSSGDKQVTAQTPSTLTGQDIYINSKEGNIDVSGSVLAAVNDLALAAKQGSINVSSGSNTVREYESGTNTSIGELGGDGYSGTVGWRKENYSKLNESTQESTIRSQLSSGSGNVTMQAGQDIVLNGADVSAGKSINLSAENVLMDVSQDSTLQENRSSSSQYGITISTSGYAVAAAQAVEKSAQAAEDGRDPRLTAIYSAQAALNIASQTVLSDMNPSAVKVTVSASAGSSSQQEKYQSQQQQGSTLKAGETVNITATQDIQGKGVEIRGKNVILDAGQDIILTAAQDTDKLESSNSGNQQSVGVGAGVGGSQNGFTFNAGVSQYKGKENGSSLVHHNSQIQADETLSITSGRDTTLKGAELSGDRVIANVGRDLTISSQQDSADYDSKQSNSGANISVCLPPICLGGVVQGSVNVGGEKITNDYDAVGEQSGIFAGSGGFDINVGNHTQLDGAVIASEADADKNRISTGTLGWTDIENKSEWEGNQYGINVSNTGMPTTTVGQVKDDNTSTTHSAISPGDIVIRDKDNQQQDIANLSRDTDNAHQALENNFDKDKIKDQLEIQKEAIALGTQAMDAYKQSKLNEAKAEIRAQMEANGELKGLTEEQINKKILGTEHYQNVDKEYGVGSDFWTNGSAATGLLAGVLGGNVTGGIAAGAAPYMAALVKDSTDNPAARAALHAIVSGALASAQGANPGAAAAGGFIASASADALAMAFYGKTADELVGDQKTMISNLVVLLGAAAGAAAGGDGQALASGGNAARVEVENNSVANGEAGMIDMLTCALTGSTTACERAYPTPEQHATGLAVSVVTIGGIAIAGATPEMIAAVNAGLKSCVTNQVLCANQLGVWAIEMLGAEAAPAGIAIGGTAAGIKLTAEQMTELAALKAIQQKGGAVTSDMVSKVLGGKGTTGNISTLNPNEIRFSQNTVSYNKIERGAGTQYNYDDLVLSMKTDGWKGDAVDVIKMPDGKLTSMDNTRIAAAREAGIDIKANTYDFNDPLPENIINSGRFGNAKTWGEAITGRINNQSGGFSKDNPYGSDSLPRITGQK